MNYVYKTTNLKNGHFYYGVHKTNKLNDGYLGSGKIIIQAIKKYGKENFKKDILKFFDSYEEALIFESKIVNENLVNPLCYNLKNGGAGGFKREDYLKGSKRGAEKFKEKFLDNEYVKIHKERTRKHFLNLYKEGKLKGGNNSFLGKRHTDETKKIIGMKNSNNQRGNKNSQFGTCWITNGIQNKKIFKGSLIPEGWKLGRKI